MITFRKIKKIIKKVKVVMKIEKLIVKNLVKIKLMIKNL